MQLFGSQEDFIRIHQEIQPLKILKMKIELSGLNHNKET